MSGYGNYGGGYGQGNGEDYVCRTTDGYGYGGKTAYTSTDDYTGYGTVYTTGYTEPTRVVDGEDYERARKEEKKHKQREHMGEFGALGAGAFALYEGYEAKKDPQHAKKHGIEAGLAAAVAAGSAGYAFHEHREKEWDKEEEKEHKHHHHLF